MRHHHFGRLPDGRRDGTSAGANPNAKYSIVDMAYNPTIPNVLGQVYATDQAAFMAGLCRGRHVADGCRRHLWRNQHPAGHGLHGRLLLRRCYHNSQKGTNVQVLGWNPSSKDGLFTGNFESLDDGRSLPRTSMTKAPTS